MKLKCKDCKHFHEGIIPDKELVEKANACGAFEPKVVKDKHGGRGE